MDTPSSIIYKKDCLDFLRTLPDDAVSLIVADPPYNIGFDGGQGWDRIRPESDWIEWCVEWTREFARVLAHGRVCIVWGTFKDTNAFMKYKIAIDDDPQLSKLLAPENEIIWSYNWGGRSKNNFARKHEYAFVWRKTGEKLLFNADNIRVERKVKKNIRTGKPYEKGTIPTCVWEFNNHTTSHEFCGWHPTTKNLDVLDRMIKAYSKEGDTIIDPFSGSGSTAISALRNNRNFIGSEVNKEYIEKSIQRIKDLTGIDTKVM